MRPLRSVRFFVSGGSVAIVCLCAVLAVPVVATTTIVETTHVLAPDARGSATASCERGEHAPVGGMRSDFFQNGTAKAVIATDLHRATGAAWTVNGVGEAGAGGSLRAVVLCASGNASVPRTIVRTVSAPPLRRTAITATCPTSEVLVGGGYHWPASSPVSQLILMTRLERVSAGAWRVVVTNFSPTTAVAVSAIAYCGTGPAPRQATALTSATGPSQTLNVTAICPGTTRLLFGGMRGGVNAPGIDPFLTVANAFAPTSNRSWRVDGQTGPMGGFDLVALAYCR